MDDEIYKEHILSLYKNPLHKYVPEHFDMKERGYNPSCGDDFTLYIQLDPQTHHVKDASFFGDGCAISQAAFSLFCEDVKGKKLSDLRDFKEDRIMDLLHIQINPGRMKCALLPYTTLKKTINTHHVNA